MSRSKKGPKGRVLRSDDVIACAHTALKVLLVRPVPGREIVEIVQAECMNCHTQLRDVSA